MICRGSGLVAFGSYYPLTSKFTNFTAHGNIPFKPEFKAAYCASRWLFEYLLQVDNTRIRLVFNLQGLEVCSIGNYSQTSKFANFAILQITNLAFNATFSHFQHLLKGR